MDFVLILWYYVLLLLIHHARENSFLIHTNKPHKLDGSVKHQGFLQRISAILPLRAETPWYLLPELELETEEVSVLFAGFILLLSPIFTSVHLDSILPVICLSVVHVPGTEDHNRQKSICP